MQIDLEHFKRHQDDVDRIVDIFQRIGLHIDPVRAYLAWSGYSDSNEAGWMSLDDDEFSVYSVLHVYLGKLGV